MLGFTTIEGGINTGKCYLEANESTRITREQNVLNDVTLCDLYVTVRINAIYIKDADTISIAIRVCLNK